MGARAFYEALSPEEREALPYLWDAWARPAEQRPDGVWDGQLAPGGAWTCWEFLAGRGAGKTRAGSEWVINLARRVPGCRIALVGPTNSDVVGTMIEGESGIIACSPPWFTPSLHWNKKRLLWPNGSRAFWYSAEKPRSARGPQHHYAWLDEVAAYKAPQEMFDLLSMGLRLGSDPRMLITTTPKNIALLKELKKQSSTVVTVGRTKDNKSTPAKFIADVLNRYGGTTLGRQELDGELFESDPNALWTPESIDNYRVREAPDLIRVLVGVDPSASDKDRADKAGIVVAGIGKDGHGYVLSDYTLKASPDAWARAAVRAYTDWNADAMVEELVKGGKLVSSLIKLVDDRIKIIPRGGNRGKATRAEPVSALYEQGKVHHVGSFQELEQQMCSWKPGDKSPNNLDALVYALSELMLQDSKGALLL